MHGIQVTVIAFVAPGRRDLGRLGQRQRQHPGAGDRAGRRGRRRGPRGRSRRGRQRAGPGPRVRRLGPRARPHRHHTSTTRSRPRSARRSAAPSGEGRVLYGFVNHEVTTTYLGSSTGPAAAPRPAHRALGVHRQAHRPEPERLGRRGDPGLRRRRPAGVRRDAGPAPRLGQAPLRPRGRPLRHDPAAERGRRRDGRRLLVRRRAGRLGGPVGLQPPAHRHPDRRGRSPARRSRSTPTRRTRAWSAPRSRWRRPRPTRARCSTTGIGAGPHRLDPRRRADRAAADPALGGDDQPAGHPGDRQPGARHRRRRAARSTTSWRAWTTACSSPASGTSARSTRRRCC